MEKIVQNRRKSIRSLVVQWGVIGNVGFVSRVGTMSINKVAEFGSICIDDCLKSLHTLIDAQDEPVISAFKHKAHVQNEATTCFREWFLSSMGISSAAVDRKSSFGDLGIDSLQTVEIRNKLAEVGVEKTVKDIHLMIVDDIWDI